MQTFNWVKQIVAASVLLISSAGYALEASPGAGVQTNAWLSMQREGTQASKNPQAASAVQREKAAERFLKTYDYAIKESFYGDNFGAGK
jgi:hypothetical protein